MELSSWIIITLVSMFFSALFSGTEIAYVTADRVRIEIDAKRGGPVRRIIGRFYSDAELFITSLLVGNNIMLVVYGMGAAALVEPLLTRYISSEALVLTAQTVISTGVILIVGEYMPKTISRINPNRTLRLLAMPIYVFYVIFYPISLLTTYLSRALMRLTGVKSNNSRLRLISIGELNDFLEETIDDLEEKSETVEKEVKIFQNALDFSSTHLRDCMTPRNEIVAVSIEGTTRADLVRLFTSSGRSKIIVYDDDIDSIRGYIHVSELFDADADWREHIKPVLYAPENFLANKMMRRLLQQKRSTAIVVDEFGGTAGLITLEDLVEEIFGDIQDEHDTSRLTQRRLADGVYEFSGRCEIEQLNEAYDLDIPEDDQYQTLAGYILCSTGAIPAQGDSIVLGGLRFEILKKSANRIELIKVSQHVADNADGARSAAADA